MAEFFDRAQQLQVVEQPVRTVSSQADVSHLLCGFKHGEGSLAAATRGLFALDGRIANMDASTLASPLRGIYDDDEPRCSTFHEIRANLSTSFGCEVDELAVTNSTTDAIAKVLCGLDLKAGDEILISDHEHFGSLAPLAVMRDRIGIKLRQVNLPTGHQQRAEDIVERFSAAITDHTRLLLFSSPTATLGTALPVRDLTRLAQRRGVMTLVDAAHMPGMLDADFHAMGADFVTGSGNKWQCGPPGTGLLYIRNRVLEEYNPTPLPVFWPVSSVWYPLEGGLPPRTTGRVPTYDVAEYVQNAGAASLSRMQALELACELWQRIGRRQIEAAILDVAGYLRDRIVEVFGANALFSPHGDRRLLSGLTTFNPFRDPLDACDQNRVASFVARLEARHGIVVKYIEFPVESRRVFGVRVATRLYHTHEDIDAFVLAARSVAAGDA